MNGWTNWETWITNMHMFDGMTARDISGTRTVTADDCKEYVMAYLDEAAMPAHEGLRSMFVTDIIGGFMSTVDWYEIAEHLTDDEEEDEEEEDDDTP